MSKFDKFVIDNWSNIFVCAFLCFLSFTLFNRGSKNKNDVKIDEKMKRMNHERDGIHDEGKNNFFCFFKEGGEGRGYSINFCVPVFRGR